VGGAALRAVHDIIEHGQRRGEVRRDVRAPVVADLLLGAYLGRYTHQGQPGPSWIRDVINTLWPGLAAR
jgi:hypothetical protein